MKNRRIILRDLVFTGISASPVRLQFDDGLNVVYGASNTGKSFVVKALNFMFGGKESLPQIKERAPYDSILLAATLPDERDVTLYRAAAGGGFISWDGLHETRQEDSAGTKLGENHSAKTRNSLSRFLLDTIGMSDKQIVKNKYGEKISFSFRHFAPFVFVDETDIMAERSSILSGTTKTVETTEKNVFKLLLTGRDDTAVVTSPSQKKMKAAMKAKVELVDELLRALESGTSGMPLNRSELERQASAIDANLDVLSKTLCDRQERVDALVTMRRNLADQFAELRDRITELDFTLSRFKKLGDVYESDLARLEALEEGGGLLVARLGRECPVCGALPEHQKYTHGADEIELAHKACVAEVKKITREQRDLRVTMSSLIVEEKSLRRRLDSLATQQQQVESELERVRPQEASIRQEYQQLHGEREEVKDKLELLHRREDLLNRKSSLEGKSGASPTTKLENGIDGATAHDFAMMVQHVLKAWHFPDNPKVSFDHERQDIRINGKERDANGKGVRALLHAAFKVGVLLFCRERGLPHPGFLVLDTPLLTYREPLKNPKYGALAEDEKAIAATSLKEHFYGHLASLKKDAQIVILENTDPPASVRAHARITVFSGDVDGERFGFF